MERAFICPPQSQIGPITPEQRRKIINGSVIFGHYEKAVDRESAYEILKSRAEQAAPAPETSYTGSSQNQRQGAGRQRETAVEAMAKSAARAIGSQIGRQIIRGVLGSIFGGRR